jgi:hypothetical protein
VSEGHGGREDIFRFAGRLSLLVSIVLFSLRGVALGEGFVSANYSLNWDQTVDKTATETTDTWTLTHTLDVNYKGFLSPTVENEITLKIDQEIQSEGDPRNTTRVSPVISLSYKGSYWNAGAKRTIEESNEPDKNTTTTDKYFIEMFYVPPRATLPDLKAKYTLDQDFESGNTDTDDQEPTLSSRLRADGLDCAEGRLQPRPERR